MKNTNENKSSLSKGVRLTFRTTGPRQHFFGYYDKSPLDAAGRRLLCHAVDFNDRMVDENDVAEIGYWDIETGAYQRLAETISFNWQQGAMLQWLPPGHDRWAIFNNCVEGEYRAVLVEVNSGERRLLPTTIYSIAANGKLAVTPNYRRLFFCRAGYGYVNVRDPRWDHQVPEGDGIQLVDLERGTERTIVTTREIVEHRHLASMDQGHNYLEHLMFNPSGTRFVFMHRWQIADGGIPTRLYAADADGGNPHMFQDSLNYGHGCWRNDEEHLIHGRLAGGFSKLRHGKGALRHFLRPLLKLNRLLPRTKAVLHARNALGARGLLLLRDGVEEARLVERRQLWDDGHGTMRPGSQNLLLLDTYPNANCRQLLLVYHLERGTLTELADLYCPRRYHAQGFRCDLHPRWDRAGKRVIVDSLQDGTRQMYVYDVEEALRELE